MFGVLIFFEGPADSTNGTCVFCDDFSMKTLRFQVSRRKRKAHITNEGNAQSQENAFFMNLKVLMT